MLPNDNYLSPLNALAQIGEVADFDSAIRESRDYLQLPSHGFNVAAQCRKIHVCPLLHLGDGGLLDMQYFGQHLLR